VEKRGENGHAAECAEVAQADEGIEINEPTKTSLSSPWQHKKQQQISPLLCILTNVLLNGPYLIIWNYFEHKRRKLFILSRN
jgi:hypothetical protein